MSEFMENIVSTVSAAQGESRLSWGDIVVIFIYFLSILGVGLWSSRRSKSDSVQGYFLASKSMHWIPVGASIFASNIGSGHFIGLAGTAASTGIAVGGYELSAVYIIMTLAWVFVPVYLSSGIYTMPEYLRERFGGQRIRVYLSILSLILYIFTKISADLFGGALFIQYAMGKSSTEWLYISVIILLAVAAVFTIAGGLTAVIWTDFVQTILMICGAFILMGTSLYKVGGISGIINDFPYAVADIQATADNKTFCGVPPKDYMNLFRSPFPGESDLPWTGMTIGLAINSIWYWCTDQVIVQRTLSSKNMVHAKAGCILAAYLKLLPLWLLVFPGMASRILFKDTVGCSDPVECERICTSSAGCTNIAYVELVLNLLPTGLAGLMLAVMMAALMSSLTSIFNSATTIFTIDVWKRFRPRANDLEQLIVAKVFVVALVFISVIWIPIIQGSKGSQLFTYIQEIQSYLSPPICAVYLLAMFWERTNEPGAFWGLMAGFAVGMLRFIIEYSYVVPPCGSSDPDPRPLIVKQLIGDVHFLHFACILFIITTVVTIAVSLLTPPIDKKHLYRLTFWSRKSSEIRYPIEDDKKEEKPEKNGSVEQIEISEPEGELPVWRKRLHKLCGLAEINSNEMQNNGPSHLNEKQKAEEAAQCIYEEPFYKKILNINAVVVMVITAFIYGIFA